MPAEIAMTPFLQQIFQEIDRRAEAESRGDPTRRIQITKELTDQVTRPVLEAAIGRSGQRMGNMAGPQARGLSQSAANQRVGESKLDYLERNREADDAMVRQGAAMSAGANLVGTLAANWPDKKRASSFGATATPSLRGLARPLGGEIPNEPTLAALQAPQPPQAPVMGPGLQAMPGTAQQPASLGVAASATDPVSQSKQAFAIAEKLRKQQELTDEERLFWGGLPDDVKQFGLIPGPLPGARNILGGT